MRLLPKEEKFFHFFNEQSDLILRAAVLLLDAVRQGNHALPDVAEEIRKLETQCDDVTHQIFIKLNQTFILPIDPEDIHRLASELDDVMDAIEEAAHRLVSFRLEPVPEHVVRLCEINAKAAESLKLALAALEKKKDLLQHCIDINRLEGEADGVFRKALADLLNTETDPIRVIKVKEILEYLESAADRFEDVADELQTIIVKNS